LSKLAEYYKRDIAKLGTIREERESENERLAKAFLSTAGSVAQKRRAKKIDLLCVRECRRKINDRTNAYGVRSKGGGR